MATTPAARASGRDNEGSVARRGTRRISTETKSALKTTEFAAFLAVLAALLIAALVVDEADAGGYGAKQAWLYATILTSAYMVSRGLAKSGSHEPYDDDRA